MSLSILLADDEPLVTQATKVLIEECNQDFTIIGELHDGKQVLNFIKDYQPDIVFLDIRMPNKDGFQILEEITQYRIETKVIILSAYRDFEYARQALHYGAIEYLTKPINKDNLMLTLNKVAKICAHEKVVQPVTNLHYIDTLLLGEKKAKSIFDEWGFFENSQSKNIQLCMLQFSNAQNYDDYKRFKKRKFDWAHYLYILWINEHYWLLIYKTGIVNIFANAEKIRKSLAAQNSYTGFSAVVDCAKFPLAYEQALLSVQYSFYNPATFSFLTYNKMTNTTNSSLITQATSNFFLEKFELGHTNDVVAIIQNWFKSIRQLRLHPKIVTENIKNLLNYLLTKTLVSSKDMTALLQDSILYLSVLESKQYYTTSTQLEYWLIEIITKLSEKNKNETILTDSQRIIMKAKSYCEHHYKEDISLDIITQEVHITKSWFCSIFKKETGQTFANYLVELRLKKASVLLATSEMKINQIAKNVGYKTASHFNHAFIEKYNVTPLEYRRLHWNKSID